MPDPTQQSDDSIDLYRLDANEVAPGGQRGAQLADSWNRHVNYRAIKAATQTFAQLQGVTCIALLLGPVRLAPHLMRIDHNRLDQSSAPREPKTNVLTEFIFAGTGGAWQDFVAERE